MSFQSIHPEANSLSLQRSLNVWSLATLLVCAHYGLGFILGTAEQAVAVGAAGSLYAVSVSIGFLALLVLVKFYWQSIDQIWTLLGKQYGQLVKIGIALMSWVSLIGVAAVQIVAAGAILSIVGFSSQIVMIGLAIAIGLLSLIPVERVSQVFRGLLLLNISILLYALWQLHSLSELELVPLQFLPDLRQVGWCHELGISGATILMVMVDMKCQQFIVQAKTVRIAYWGCILAAIALFGLAFLPTTVVLAGQHQNIVSETLSSKEILPYILAWAGGGVDRWQGILFLLSLAVPALGIGSNVLRIQTKTILDLKLFSATSSARIWITILNSLLVFLIALRGGEIVNLTLNFYAAYLSSVWVPLIAYLLAEANRYVFSPRSVQLALLMGMIASISTLAIILINSQFILFGSSELTIMLVGISTSCLTLLLVQLFLQTFLGHLRFLDQKEV